MPSKWLSELRGKTLAVICLPIPHHVFAFCLKIIRTVVDSKQFSFLGDTNRSYDIIYLQFVVVYCPTTIDRFFDAANLSCEYLQ